ncbi:hypothetical protein ACQJBY_043652 [Aegilops geniculata]
MSACPSLTLSCDNLSCNIWFCCGSAKDPEPYPTKQSHVVTAPPPAVPSELVPPHQVSPPAMQEPYHEQPSELVPPHHVSPAAAAAQAASTAAIPRAPVPPCNNRAREPPAPAATPLPAAVPSKRYEPPQPAPPNETPVQRVMPSPARLPSKKYEPPTPQAPPPVTVTSQPSSARTTWPPRVKSKTYDDAGVPPALSLPPPSTPIAPRAHGSRYPPAPHPHLGDREPRIVSYSQAASLHQEYY